MFYKGEGMCSVQISVFTRNKSLSLCPIQAKAWDLLGLVEKEIPDSLVTLRRCTA